MKLPCGGCGTCRTCWLAENDDRYRRLFNGEVAKVNRLCVHLGRLTDQKVACPSCNPNLKKTVTLVQCNVHQTCTPSVVVEGVMCCRSCRDYQERPSVVDTAAS